MSSEKVKTYINNVTDDLKDIAELELELVKVKTVKKLGLKGSAVLSKLVLIILFSTTVFLFMITLALYLGELLGKWYLGFAAITLIYLFLYVLLVIFKEALLKKPICNSIIKSILN